MGIVSHRELARTADFTLGENPVARRTFVLTLSDDTLQNNPPNEQDIISTLGLVAWGQAHPTYTGLGLRKITLTERAGDSPYHVEAVTEYGSVTDNELLAPTLRDAEWSFESQPSQVPAFYYFFGSSNGDVRRLTNSAYDFIEGLTTDEAMVRATIKKNYAAFPSAQMIATNSVNSDSYFGGGAYTWKCAGVNATRTVEYFNLVKYTYWATQIELLYRQTSWLLILPDVGWNYLEGGVKKRAMVFDEKNAEWVASANPVGLDGQGGQTLGQPAVLFYRVNPAVAFTALFGTPP